MIVGRHPLTDGDERPAGPTLDDHTYRPHLDGLRAVAVYLVVAFHAGADRMANGFIGVDIFFVLSGYLVTTILLRDLGRGLAAPLRRFYARRARRLLPAALVNLVVTAAVFAAIAPPAEFQAAIRAIRSAALYFSNWFFIGESANYFAKNVAASPVIHYWSLSAEEQFYVAWPLLLYVLWRLLARTGARRDASMRLIVVLGAAASLGAALAIARINPNRAYFGTDTRAYQLLGGALLALSPSVIQAFSRESEHRLLTAVKKIAPTAALGSLVVLATTTVSVGPVSRGALTVGATLILLVAIEAWPAHSTARLLALPGAAYLGRVSYGTYLWHWIVILVIKNAYPDAAPVTVFLAAATLATGLASLSYQLLERPIRASARLDRRAVPVIATGLALSVLVGIVVTPRLLNDEQDSGVAVATRSRGTPNHAPWRDAQGDSYAFADCGIPWQPTPCKLADGASGTIAIVGDSHATMLTPMIVDLARRHDLAVWSVFTLACPWPRGVRYAAANPKCVQYQDTIFDELIPKIDPDIVILAHRPVDVPGRTIELLGPGDTPLSDVAEQQRTLRKAVASTVEQLRADGRSVVLVEPMPVARTGDDPLACLSEAKYLEECRFVVPERRGFEETELRTLAQRDHGVWSLDLDRLICPFLPICDPVVGGRVPWLDDNHITLTFGRTLRPAVERFFLDNGIIKSSVRRPSAHR